MSPGHSRRQYCQPPRHCSGLSARVASLPKPPPGLLLPVTAAYPESHRILQTCISAEAPSQPAFSATRRRYFGALRRRKACSRRLPGLTSPVFPPCPAKGSIRRKGVRQEAGPVTDCPKGNGGGAARRRCAADLRRLGFCWQR